MNFNILFILPFLLLTSTSSEDLPRPDSLLPPTPTSTTNTQILATPSTTIFSPSLELDSTSLAINETEHKGGGSGSFGRGKPKGGGGRGSKSHAVPDAFLRKGSLVMILMMDVMVFVLFWGVWN